MPDILYDLYVREQEANRPDCREDPRYRSLEVLLDQQYESIRKALGSRFLDDLFSLQLEQQAIEKFGVFRHGFRLAVRFILL